MSSNPTPRTIVIYQSNSGKYVVHFRGLPDKDCECLSEAEEHAAILQAANGGSELCRIVIRPRGEPSK